MFTFNAKGDIAESAITMQCLSPVSNPFPKVTHLCRRTHTMAAGKPETLALTYREGNYASRHHMLVLDMYLDFLQETC